MVIWKRNYGIYISDTSNYIWIFGIWLTKTKHQIKGCNLVNGFKKIDYLKKDIFTYLLPITQ